MDATVASLMEQSAVSAHQAQMEALTIVNTNLVQVGGVINEQATAGKAMTSDDAGIFAALRASRWVPQPDKNAA